MIRRYKRIVPYNFFYDAISSDYNSHMSEADKKVRGYVRKKTREYVPSGNILDFGGGTGIDMQWMLEDGYNVIFLEPSSGMRSVARIAAENFRNKPYIIEENILFEKWVPTKLPFDYKVDGILANFAVLNCIKDVATFFEKISLVMKSNSYLLATVIDSRLITVLKKHSLKAALLHLFNAELVTSSNYNGLGHETYIHSLKRFKAASKKHFIIIEFLPLKYSNFSLIILSKR